MSTISYTDPQASTRKKLTSNFSVLSLFKEWWRKVHSSLIYLIQNFSVVKIQSGHFWFPENKDQIDSYQTKFAFLSIKEQQQQKNNWIGETVRITEDATKVKFYLSCQHYKDLNNHPNVISRQDSFQTLVIVLQNANNLIFCHCIFI